MPPAPPLAVPPESAELDAPSEAIIASIYAGDGFAQGIKLNAFNQTELVTRMIAQIRDANPKISSAAIKNFLAYTKDVLRVNGQLVSGTQREQTDAKGRTVTTRSYSASALRERPPAVTNLPSEGVRRTPAVAPPSTQNVPSSDPAGPGPTPP